MMKLLHKQIPLNIISQYVEIANIDNNEITKILRQTYTNKGFFNLRLFFKFYLLFYYKI